MNQIILTGSCYWCLEALFQKLDGVLDAESGFYKINGYDFAFTEKDRLEAIKLTYDPDILSLEKIFDVFYITHNPTLVKWEMDDCFYPLCRSAVFYLDEDQKNAINERIELDIKNNTYTDPIQTKVAEANLDYFTPIEDKDKRYYEKNPEDGYCVSIINPKLEKLAILLKK